VACISLERSPFNLLKPKTRAIPRKVSTSLSYSGFWPRYSTSPAMSTRMDRPTDSPSLPPKLMFNHSTATQNLFAQVS
jgi:hypothetical protein